MSTPQAPPGPALSGTILVVDDMTENVDMLGRRLLSRGFAVKAAKNGATALNFVGSDPIDLVLLDVMMPGINGLEVLRAIRTRFTLAQLPVIMVSARDDQAMMVHCFAAGANDYVTKPLDFGLLLARIVVHVRLRQAFAALAAKAAA